MIHKIKRFIFGTTWLSIILGQWCFWFTFIHILIKRDRLNITRYFTLFEIKIDNVGLDFTLLGFQIYWEFYIWKKQHIVLYFADKVIYNNAKYI
jgi:hypothetical protein